MDIITGYRGTPHITAVQDRDGNQGAYGVGSYVLNVGNKLAASVISNNEIRISDGVISHQGCLASIGIGLYDSVAIDNGAQGQNRIDLIVARYTKDVGTDVEDISLAVIKGLSVSGTPSAPDFNAGEIQEGDTPVDMPLYQVRLTGISVASCTAVFTTLKTQAETDALLGSTSISGIGNGTATGALSALNTKIGNTSMGTTATTLTGAIAEVGTNLNALKYAKYEHKTFNSVTNAYSSSNILTFEGSVINGANFANGAFLVILNASATTGRSSMYLLILGANATAYYYWLIGTSDEAYHPVIGTTGSGSPYIYWSASLSATVYASTFKL